MCAHSHAQVQTLAHSHTANISPRRALGTYLRKPSTDVRKLSRSRHTCAKCHADDRDLRRLSTDMGTLSRKEKDMRTLSSSKYIHARTDMQQLQMYLYSYAPQWYFGLFQPELYKKEMLVRQTSSDSSGTGEMEYCGKLHFALRYDSEIEGLVVKVTMHFKKEETKVFRHLDTTRQCVSKTQECKSVGAL